MLDEVADWSVLATADKSWLVGFGCTATRLAFLRGGSPPVAIVTARANKTMDESIKLRTNPHTK